MLAIHGIDDPLFVVSVGRTAFAEHKFIYALQSQVKTVVRHAALCQNCFVVVFKTELQIALVVHVRALKELSLFFGK